MEKKVTPWHPINQIQTGHFYMRNSYYSWRPKGTPDWLYIYTVDGRGRFGYKDFEFVSHPGDLVLIPPNVAHDYSLEDTLKYWELLWAHFHPRPEWLPYLRLKPLQGGMRTVSITKDALGREVLELLNSVNRHGNRIRRRPNAAEAKRLGSYEARQEALAMNSLERIWILLDELGDQSQKSAELDERIKKSLDYITENFASPLSIEGMAKQAGLSSSRFAHLFSEQVGQSPVEYLEFQRLTKAAQLLQMTQQTVSEISSQVGYSNAFYFSLRFKKHTRQSPREFRKKFQV